MRGKASKEYQDWSRAARHAQIDTGMTNKRIAEKLGYSRQFVTAVVNGRRESREAITRISKCLKIPRMEKKDLNRIW